MTLIEFAKLIGGPLEKFAVKAPGSVEFVLKAPGEETYERKLMAYFAFDDATAPEGKRFYQVTIQEWK